MAYTGKTIKIQRHFNMIEMSQEDPEVTAWLGQAYKAIGPYFDNGGKSVGKGLTFEEQKLLLPDLLGVEPHEREWRNKVDTFYHEFLTKIPKQGLELHISLQDDNAPLSTTNMPQNLMDYIRMRHIMSHPQVGKDQADAEKHQHKRFYIVDPDNVAKGAIDVNTLEDKATVVYMKYKDDQIKIDQILTVLGVNIKSMKHEDKVLKLKSFVKKDSKFNEIEQTESFQRFIEAAEDKDLEYKYLIQEMIGAQYLQRVGNNIIYKESGKKIGDNLQDTVLYFKNPKNSRDLNLLKAEYQLKIKKGDKYLPKENPEPVINDQITQ